MPKVALDSIQRINRTGYPPPFDQPMRGRWSQKIGAAFALTDFDARARRLVEPAPLARRRG
jgi:uncharacterized cupin superfamily protein